MINRQFKISIIIPVYNEADSLEDCLDAIDCLERKPYEVIVVDNNSTDNTKEVALRHDSVKVVQEKRQGVVYARAKGFDVASGELVARIDADTIVPSKWLDKINQLFNEDRELAAVSGSADYYDFIFPEFANFLDRFARRYLELGLKDWTFLHGSNMAIKKSAWKSVRESVCVSCGIHEDLDLGIHLQKMGQKVVYNPTMVAGISTRRISSGYSKFIAYTLVSPRTYAAHGLKCQRFMYPIILFCWLIYAPAHLIFLSYNPLERTFSLKQLFKARINDARVDPTANVY